MSSENAKPDQIQASVAAALSRLRGDLSPAAAPQQPASEQPRAANDLRADPFFKSIQSTPQPTQPQSPSQSPGQSAAQSATQSRGQSPSQSSPSQSWDQPRAPIPMTPFTRMQASPEPAETAGETAGETATEASEPMLAEDDGPMPTMPEPMSASTASTEAAAEPNVAEPAPVAMPEPAQAKPARQSVVERQAAQAGAPQGSALSRMIMRGDADRKPAGADPMQRDLLADLPPPPISEPLSAADTEDGAHRRRRRNRLMLGGALGVIILALGAWLWSGGEGDTEVPVITAETTPEKVAPTEPGGVDVPNQNIQILNGTEAQSQEETVMPAPEQPVAPPQATAEPATSEAPAIEEPGAASGAATTTAETNAAPSAPATEAPATETPAADAPPAPEVPLASQPLPEQTEAATNAAPPAPEAPAVTAPATTEPTATDPSTTDPGTAVPSTASQAEQPATQQTADAPAAQAPAEQPASEPAATQQASVAPSAGNTRIQLAAVKSEAAAKTEWAKMQKAHPDLLGALTLTVQKVDKGTSGVFYRIQAGPLADKSAAKQLCASLKAQNQDCIVASK